MRFRLAIFAATAAVAGLAGCSQAEQTSGFYMASNSKAMFLIQIVKTSDGRVTGTLEQMELANDGSIGDETFPIEGVIDGDQLSLKAADLNHYGQTFSGTVRNNRIELMAGNGSIVLSRSTLEKVSAAKNDLTAIARATIAGNNRAKAEAENQALLRALKQTGEQIDKTLVPRFPAYEENTAAFVSGVRKRHGEIVSQITALKAQWRLLPGNSREVVEDEIRAQSDNMRTLQDQLQDRMDSDRIKLDSVHTYLLNFEQGCDKALSVGMAPAPEQCSKAKTYLSLYENSRATMRAYFMGAVSLFEANH